MNEAQRKVLYSLEAVRYEDGRISLSISGTDSRSDIRSLLKAIEREINARHARAVPLTAEKSA